MARIRTIKPEFFTDSKITSLTPLARLFYVSLWCEADRAGRLKWDPMTLKYRYLPADKARVEDLGDELIRVGLIRLYQVDGQIYADIPGFVKHQVINNREAESSFPAFSADACLTRERGVRDAAYGKEGRKGREGKEGTPPVVPQGDDEESKFAEFWKAYPSRGRAANPKHTALRAWRRAIGLGANPDDLIRLAPTAAPAEKHGTEFVPQAATWLNQSRWKDAPPPVETTGDPEETRWQLRVSGFARSGYWNRDQWGPAPNEAGCRAPKHLIPASDNFDPEREMPRELRQAPYLRAMP